MSGALDEEEALLACAPVPPDGRIAYGDHPDQVVDLYLPPEAPRGPLTVLLHGGFWRVAYDRTHLSPLAAALAREGLPVALAEYRRAGGGGGFTETFNDVTNAVRVAAAEAGEDASVVVAGHSAGGHLALWAAARSGPVTAAVAIAPVADLARAHELRLSDGAVAEFLTGHHDDAHATGHDDGHTTGHEDGLAERIAAVDPVRLPPRVPVTVLHGTEDPDVPVDLSRRYVAAHRGTGAAAPALHELPGAGHYAAVTPGTAAYGALVAVLRHSDG
ncbi:alpha/beta hydrolase family protein [Streptomyces purpurogeneiscleroticus]|uniref:alpha/beta hydrolase family protein n=1 Tax=Streptomyces purpurogeneiscleroticus TaxID=68259 RepID=UPI001CBB2306|nr:alpha/beta hydrolase [Streptomyces purpurogeneiscleroticus]MBZ4019735.1 alpha/beta hydrolase [Streptomyces purpurogeneiscleroticus]